MSVSGMLGSLILAHESTLLCFSEFVIHMSHSLLEMAKGILLFRNWLSCIEEHFILNNMYHNI